MEAQNLDKLIENEKNVVAIPPLPYLYDPDNERTVAILNKVATFCGKEYEALDSFSTGDTMGSDDTDDIKQPTKSEASFDRADPAGTNTTSPGGRRGDSKELIAEKADYYALVWQVIRYLSSIACWTSGADDTFILQQRTQNFTTKQEKTCGKLCDPCEDAMIKIPLEFSPLASSDDPVEKLEHYFEPTAINPFIGGKIVVMIRGKRCERYIPSEYLIEHFDAANDKIYIDRFDFPELFLVEGCCDCTREAHITLWYNAGYPNIPDGLLPLICPLIQKIEDSKMDLNECANIMNRVSGLLKRKKIGNVQYEWSDNDTALAKTERMYVELFNLANMAELYAISRCELVSVQEAGDVI